MTARAGWFLDPDNPSREMYWNGGAWIRAETRIRTDGAVPFPRPTSRPSRMHPDDVDDDYQAVMLEHAAAQTDALQQVRGYLAFLAWVVAIGIILGVIGAVAAVIVAVR